jgi:hypothetical protein
MNQRIPEEWLTAYLDNELDSAKRAQVEAALLQDHRLTEHLQELISTRKLVSRLPLFPQQDLQMTSQSLLMDLDDGLDPPSQSSLASLDEQELQQTLTNSNKLSVEFKPKVASIPWRWMALAASLLCLAAVGAALWYPQGGTGSLLGQNDNVASGASPSGLGENQGMMAGGEDPGPSSVMLNRGLPETPSPNSKESFAELGMRMSKEAAEIPDDGLPQDLKAAEVASSTLQPMSEQSIQPPPSTNAAKPLSALGKGSEALDVRVLESNNVPPTGLGDSTENFLESQRLKKFSNEPPTGESLKDSLAESPPPDRINSAAAPAIMRSFNGLESAPPMGSESRAAATGLPLEYSAEAAGGSGQSQLRSRAKLDEVRQVQASLHRSDAWENEAAQALLFSHKMLKSLRFVSPAGEKNSSFLKEEGSQYLGRKSGAEVESSQVREFVNSVPLAVISANQQQYQQIVSRSSEIKLTPELDAVATGGSKVLMISRQELEYLLQDMDQAKHVFWIKAIPADENDKRLILIINLR